MFFGSDDPWRCKHGRFQGCGATCRRGGKVLLRDGIVLRHTPAPYTSMHSQSLSLFARKGPVVASWTANVLQLTAGNDISRRSAR